MSPATPSLVYAGPAAPLRRSQQNSPPSTSSLSQDRRPHPQGSRLPAARQPQARLGRLRPRPRPAVSVPRRATHEVRPARPAHRQHRYQEARTDRNFKNAGSVWAQTPQAVNDHDFRSQADAIAIPYGVYDVGANRGFVVLGTCHDTPDFAADNLVRWWHSDGLERYRYASELLLRCTPALSRLKCGWGGDARIAGLLGTPAAATLPASA